MKKSKTISVKSLQAPKSISGIDFSDHLNYWNFGFSAVMVTNTGFYRNFHYHKSTDKLQIIDFQRMAGVINEVHRTLIVIQ